MEFVGREKEMQILNRLLDKKSASFAVIRGRRRIGKSRLIAEFVRGKKSYTFSGVYPEKEITKQDQLNAFATQMAELFQIPKFQVSGWDELFTYLGKQVRKGRVVLVLDEISWMGSKDPLFSAHLKNAWDLYFSKNPQLILIVCGSISSWIEKKILNSSGFVGRVSIDLKMKELSLQECQEFWKAQNNHVSPYEKFKILSITGGVPKYLEEIHPQEPAESNIQRICFQSEGILFREYNQLFLDLFSKRWEKYDKIVKLLAKGSMDLDQLCAALKLKKSGVISKYMRDLISCGFVAEEVPWDLKDAKPSALKTFRLRDNYLRFYVKYIDPNKTAIDQDVFSFQSLANLPRWETIMGLQFENLVVNNLVELCRLLKIELHDIVRAGPFFQKQTKRQPGCQIDLLIQTRFHTLYVCEIKFQISPIQKSIVTEVQKKIESLSRPRHMSVRPVLIHVNGVAENVNEGGFFAEIVDFSDFLKGAEP